MINEAVIKRHFDTDGFVRVSGLLAAHEICALRDAIDQHMSHLDESPTSNDFQALSELCVFGSR